MTQKRNVDLDFESLQTMPDWNFMCSLHFVGERPNGGFTPRLYTNQTVSAGILFLMLFIWSHFFHIFWVPMRPRILNISYFVC